MQTADIAIGVLAVVAVLGSALGIALYDAPDDLTWDISYRTDPHDLGEQVLETTLTGDGSEDSETWVLEADNVTEVRFGLLVSGSAARAGAVSVEFEIEAPNGASATETVTLAEGAGQTADGTLTVDVGFPADLPTEVNATSREAAVEQVPVSDEGTGNWTVTVRITQEGGLPVVGGQPEQVTITVTAEEYTAYTAELVVRSPDLSPAA